MNEEVIEEAYRVIHDELALMPVPFCQWKIQDSEGVVTKKTVGSYRTNFF